MRLWRDYTFEAAHYLPLVPDDHKCRRLHGHSYKITLQLDGPVQGDGMVLDFAILDQCWACLHDQLDHRCLNEIEGLENPTSENLAVWIWDQLALSLGPLLACVTVSEKQRSRVEYSGEPVQLRRQGE